MHLPFIIFITISQLLVCNCLAVNFKHEPPPISQIGTGEGALQNNNDDFEQSAFNRQRAEVLCSAFLYDVDEEARAKVDANDYASVYSIPSMRAGESLHILGRELALVADTDLAKMPMELAERAIERVEDEGRRKIYKEEFAKVRFIDEGDPQGYYRLYAQIARDRVLEQHKAKQQIISAIQEQLTTIYPPISETEYTAIVNQIESTHPTNSGVTLSDYTKAKIYNTWVEEKKAEEIRKQKQEKRQKRIKKKRILNTIGITCAIVISLIIILKAYQKRAFILKHIQPLKSPFPLTICVLLGIAAFELPYGYYQFLRIAVTIWGIITLYKLHNQEPANRLTSLITLISGGITILYNPILPIQLDKDHWTIINLISIPIILLITYLTAKPLHRGHIRE